MVVAEPVVMTRVVVLWTTFGPVGLVVGVALPGVNRDVREREHGFGAGNGGVGRRGLERGDDLAGRGGVALFPPVHQRGEVVGASRSRSAAAVILARRHIELDEIVGL